MSVEFPNIRHLRAFAEVAEAGGISAAADRVHLSQPAVTHAIAKLEQTLGAPLFERRAQAMFLTEAGDALLTRVNAMFSLLAQGSARAIRIAARRGEKGTPDFHTRTTASQLRALVAIFDAGNFSLAARSIGISQPSIHRAGRDLEKTASLRFFTATRKGVELTEAAEAFTRHVMLAAAELRQGVEEITRLAGRDSARIVVGSMPLSRSAILPDAIHKLLSLEGTARVQVRTVDGPYAELLRGLRFGELDFLIGALRDPVPTEDVVQEALFEDPLCVVVAKDHPLAGKSGLCIEDTLAYPWLAAPKPTPSGSYLFETLRIGERENTPVRVVSSSLSILRGLMARGPYVTLLSQHQLEHERKFGLVVPLDIALPGSMRPIGLTFRAGWTPTPTQERFLDLVRAAAGYPQNE